MDDIKMSHEGLPDLPALNELKKLPQWVAWKYEDRGGPKPTKPPVNPHNGLAASTDSPGTWGTYEQAERRAKKDSLAGVGFVLTEDDNLTGYDFDNCFTRKGRLKPWAFELLTPLGLSLSLVRRLSRRRWRSAEEKTFTIIGFAPGSRGEPIYRLKHVEKELSQVAQESELTKY
jgi:hypothetical protein